MLKKNIAVVMLAAGKSTRMKSAIPKVLHPICGRPMIGYVLDLISSLRADQVVAVLGYKHQEVRKFLKAGVKVVIQKHLLGTGDAVKEALPLLKNFKGTVLVLYADNPLLKIETIAKLLKHHAENNSDATLLTAVIEKPAGYGRILRDKCFNIRGIIEEKDADEVQKEIKEINTGIICFNKEKLEKALKLLRPDNRKKEYYLTDTIEIIYKGGGLVDAVKIADIQEALGINSRVELSAANSIMQKRLNEGLMLQGITIVDPRSTFISYGAKIGRDSMIYPFTVIERDVKIGKRSAIGPFVHLRKGTELGDEVVVGNFVETVRSKLGNKTWARHFSYLGDAHIGKGVNIGAGTVTANFDGKNKNKTIIKDKAFIGSDTVLVAPVKVGKSAVTGAGSAVVRDVADKAVVVGVPARPIRRCK
jgi:bifunctional UDP-N-acetylglucosamine pyrophosphorylase/glucosamine-1-phosphate N-acetyltransferase